MLEHALRARYLGDKVRGLRHVQTEVLDVWNVIQSSTGVCGWNNQYSWKWEKLVTSKKPDRSSIIFCWRAAGRNGVEEQSTTKKETLSIRQNYERKQVR